MVYLIIAVGFIFLTVVAAVLYKKHRNRSLLKHIRKQTPYVEVTPPPHVKKLGE